METLPAIQKSLTPKTREEKEFRQDFHGDLIGDNILNIPLDCTVCGTYIQHRLVTFKNVHLFLDVLVCQNCNTFYWKQIGNVDILPMICRWCGKTNGNLISCFNCSQKFCEECIWRNVPQNSPSNEQNKKWTCIVCDSRPVWSLRALCDLVFSWKDKQIRKKKEQFKNKKESSECVVCLDAEARIAFCPCGHLCICEKCLPDYEKTFKECPTCKKAYENTLKIYL